MRYYSSTAGAYTLATSCSDTATSMEVSSTAGMPSQYPFTLVVDVGTTAEEIVTVTNVAGTSLTVQRGQDGSPSQAHQAGAVVRHMATARDFREPQQHIDATVAHGRSSALVAVDDPQTLKNKTFDTSNTFPAPTKASLPSDTVYTSATQTLTGKTISGASNTLTNIPKSALPSDIYYGTATTRPVTALGTVVSSGPLSGVFSWSSGDVVSDATGMWAAGAPTRLTAQTTGKYLVSATANNANTGSAGDPVTMSVRKNGTAFGSATTGSTAGGDSVFGSMAVIQPVSLAAGDYVDMFLSSGFGNGTYSLIVEQIA